MNHRQKSVVFIFEEIKMEYTIEEQKQYLKENLEVEPLRKFDGTKDELKNFN